jgi:flagellar biosynthesis protein FlhB
MRGRTLVFWLLPAILLAQTQASDTLTGDVLALFENLVQLLIALFTIVIPILIGYGFVKGALDAIKALPLALIAQTTASTNASAALDQFGALVTSLVLIVLPFSLLLLFYKALIKLIRW